MRLMKLSRVTLLNNLSFCCFTGRPFMGRFGFNWFLGLNYANQLGY